MFMGAPPKKGNRSLTAYLSPGLILTAQWSYWFLTFNTSKTKLVKFNHHRDDPEFSRHIK